MKSTRAKRSAVTIGTFDGIHLGHRALLSRTSEIALANDFISIAFTFDKPPQNYLGRKKALLMPPEKKLQLLTHHVDHVEVADFLAVQPLTPEEFVAEVLVEKLNAGAVVIGEDFCFGVNRQGNVTTLSQLSSIHNFTVEVVPPVLVDDQPVSSTLIRESLRAGNVGTAERLLGKPHRLWGVVVRGEELAKSYGYPTANLQLDEDVIVPGKGIYASQVALDGDLLPAALYIGHRPTTFDEGDISVEVHILDRTDLELYGSELEVQLLSYIRADEKFVSEEELKAAISRDIKAIRSFFAQRG